MGEDEVSLRHVIEASRRLDELGTTRLIGDAAEAVHKAQSGGQPLGTLTPDAILVIATGRVQLALGAPAVAYSSPERLRGSAGDRRSDVYSLGVILWEALAHTRLYSGATDEAVKAAILAAEFRPPSEQNANVPAELDAICKKALARDPADRYQSAKVMAAEIGAVLDDAGYPEGNDDIARYLAREFPDGPPPVVPRPPVIPVAATPAPKREEPRIGSQTMLGVAPLKDELIAPAASKDKPATNPADFAAKLPTTLPPAKSSTTPPANKPAGTTPPVNQVKPEPTGGAPTAAAVGLAATPIAPVAAPAPKSPTTPPLNAAATIPSIVKPTELDAKPSSPLAVAAAAAGIPLAAAEAAAAAPAGSTLMGQGAPASAPKKNGVEIEAKAEDKPAWLGGAKADKSDDKKSVDAAWSVETPATIVDKPPAPERLPSASTPPANVAKAEAKPEPKVEPKVETKAEPKVEAKPEPKVEAKPEAKKPEAKIEEPDPRQTLPGFSASRPPVDAPATGPTPKQPAVLVDTPPTGQPVVEKPKALVVESGPATQPMPTVAPPAETATPGAPTLLASHPGMKLPDLPPGATSASSSASAPTFAQTQILGSGAHPAPAAPAAEKPSIANAVTVGTPAVAVEPATARADSHADDFAEDQQPSSGVHPASVVALPRRRRPSTSGGSQKDMLAGWGWQTDSHTAINDSDDDDYAAESQKQKKRLLIAIGGAVGAILLITLIAFAFSGGKKDEKKPTEAAQPAADPNLQAPPPEQPAQQPAQPQVAEQKSDGSAQAPEQKIEPMLEPVHEGSAIRATIEIVKTAEEKKAEEDAKKAEEKRLADEKKKADEVAKKAEDKRLADEKKKADDAKKAEDKRLADEKKKADDAKKAEAKRIADEKKKADDAKRAEIAKKDPPPKKDPAPVDPYAAKDPTPKPDPSASYKAGMQQFAKGDTAGALTNFNAALKGGNAAAYRGLGMVYEKMGNSKQAADAYRSYLKSNPGASDAASIRQRLDRLGS